MDGKVFKKIVAVQENTENGPQKCMKDRKVFTKDWNSEGWDREGVEKDRNRLEKEKRS